MSDENEIDFAKATDAQLEAARAELKKRRPFVELEGQDWANMSDTEFANKKEKVFTEMRQVGKDKATYQELKLLVNRDSADA